MKTLIIVVLSILAAVVIGFLIYRRVVHRRLEKVFRDTMTSIFFHIIGLEPKPTEKESPKGTVLYLDPYKSEKNSIFVRLKNKIFKNGKDRKDTIDKEIS